MPRTKGVVKTSTAPSSAAKQSKRTAPEDTQETQTTPGTRTSKRLKLSPATGKSTPIKSKYFEDSEDEKVESAEEQNESGYEDEVESEEEQQSSESEIEYNSEEDVKPKKNRPGKSPSGTVLQNKELWREGVKTGLGPGKVVYIDKPQAKGDGGIKHVPERIHPNTMEFLKDLKKNNDRMWFKAHDPDYRQAWKDFESFVETLTEKITEIDETIPELPPKDLVFRVYRDIRFSSDPTPYKPHFSAAWSRTGRKGPYACYYVQIKPGDQSFVGCGLWHPDAQPVRLLRTDIDQSRRLRDVLLDPDIRKHIFGGIKKDEKLAVKQFCNQNAGNALKTKPKVRNTVTLTDLTDQ